MAADIIIVMIAAAVAAGETEEEEAAAVTGEHRAALAEAAEVAEEGSRSPCDADKSNFRIFKLR
jgi:hypothetical protein